MQIVLIRKSEIYKTVLPQKVSGQHQVICDINGVDKPLLSVSAKKGKWIIRQNKLIDILDGYSLDDSNEKFIEIKCNEFYPIKHISTDEKMIVLVEPTDSTMADF